MDKLFKLVNSAKEKAIADIRARQKMSLSQFREIAERINQSYQDNGVSAYSVIDLDSNYLSHQEESQKFPPFVRIGKLTPVNVNAYVKEDSSVPFLFPFAKANATTFILHNDDAKGIHTLFTLIAFRFMLSLPRGMFKMWFVDNNYGKDFNIISKLDQKIIGDSIITSHSNQIKLLDSLEKNIVSTYQKVLITEDSLVEYNEKAGSMAQPYTFVFISNFPSQFNQESSEKLISMIKNGNAAKAGVFFFISIDESIQPSRGVDVERLKEVSSVIYQNSPIDYEIQHSDFSKSWNEHFNIVLDSQLPENFEKIVELINGKKEKANTLSFVPYFKKRWESGDIWKANSTDEINIPIGFVNPQTEQRLQFGKYTNDYFGLIGGLPRMGKTNLLHNIILWGALEYSPFELNYYLIDCKNGTGFNAYRELPHIKILSISNDREFGASALDSLIKEMYSRAEVFKKASSERGVLIENIQSYRKVTGEKMPRILAIVDEFQVLFENEDKVARLIRSDLNKLFREGPAFGISIILSSQGIGGVDVPIKNITWRLSFRLLSDMESQRILGNDGALKLTRVGNAIINNQNGEKDANINFQVALLGDELYEYVYKLRDKYKREYPEIPLSQFLSDGDNNGHIERNKPLLATLRSENYRLNDRYCDIYIGEPAFIREKHAFIRIRRQQGSNVIMVGKDTKSALTVTALINYMLDRQSSPGSRFYIVDCFNIDNEYAERLEFLKSYSPNIEVAYSRNLGDVIGKVYAELERRVAEESAGVRNKDRVCLSILYMQNCRGLKKEGYNVSPITKQLIRIIKEGPEYGIHTILHSLSYQGMQEILDSSAINEFENRIALDSGKSMSIISEPSSSQIRAGGTVLLQGPDEFMTYNPDLIRVYSVFNHSGESSNDSIRFIDELLKM